MAAGGTGVGIKSKAESGPVVLNISKELTREIFEEFPVVQDAYARYVPGVRPHLSLLRVWQWMLTPWGIDQRKRILVEIFPESALGTPSCQCPKDGSRRNGKAQRRHF